MIPTRDRPLSTLSKGPLHRDRRRRRGWRGPPRVPNGLTSSSRNQRSRTRTRTLLNNRSIIARLKTSSCPFTTRTDRTDSTDLGRGMVTGPPTPGSHRRDPQSRLWSRGGGGDRRESRSPSPEIGSTKLHPGARVVVRVVHSVRVHCVLPVLLRVCPALFHGVPSPEPQVRWTPP